MSLQNKTAAIVGGGTGIGLAIAKALAGAGAKVAIGGRRLEVLKSAASGTAIKYKVIDVASRASVGEFFDWFFADFGELDILVHAAGVNIRNRSMESMPPEEWDRVLSINATGTYNCFHATLPHMRKRKQGTIINVSSIAGKRAIALGGIAYSASKFAASALGICVSNEVAADGVRITNVYPGEVNTPLLEQRPQPVSDEHRERILKPEQVAELVLSIVQLPPNVHVPEVVIKPLSQQWF